MKLGIDPTTPDIHLGHTVVLEKLREFQDAGHPVVLIIGDFTARVGDPSGRSSTRPMLSRARRSRPTRATYQEQAFKVLDRERTEVRRNSEWLEMRATELFGLAGHGPRSPGCSSATTSPSGYGGDEPIAALELLYPLLQGYDSVAVEADVELGGTDQKFNLLFGRDIQARLRPAAAVDPDDADPGRHRRRQKMSKSLGQLRRRHRAAGGDVRQADEHPRRGDGRVLPAAARRAGRPGAPPTRPSGSWRAALVERFHGDGARRGGRGALQPGLRRARGARGDRGAELGRAGRTARSTCRR